MSGTVFQQIVSLGPACRTKFNVQRVFGKHIARRGVFDWQVTPTFAFTEYLRRDFNGMFDRADLAVKDGDVMNVRFDTLHPHQFPKGMTDAKLDELYRRARRSHDQWCAITRAAIHNKRSTLFVLGCEVPEAVPEALRSYIARVAPGKRFLILQGPDDPEPYWEGTAEIWDKHLSSFEVRPPFQVHAGLQLYRLRKNLVSVVPARLRRRLQAA